MTSSPMKFVSAREASVLSMKASVLFQAYASASRERTTSMDADDAGAAVTVAIDSGDDDEEFSPPSNCMGLVCSLVIVIVDVAVGWYYFVVFVSVVFAGSIIEAYARDDFTRTLRKDTFR